MCALASEDGADSAIAALAGKQHGVVSRTQLLAAGITRRQIQWRLKRGRLHRVHRGVYSVGHAVLSQQAIWMAAVLAGGDRAALSHWSARSLLRIRRGGGPRAHVSCPRRRRNTETITFHYAQLPDDEVTIDNGIPTTTPARTLLDLAPLLPSHSLARMVAAVGPQPGTSLTELLDRYPRRPGTAKLRAIIAEPTPVTRSDFEAEWLERIDRAGLPNHT